jgi:hypothetical protein
MTRMFPIRESKANRTVQQGDRISMKYLGTLDRPIAKMISDPSKVVVVEISPNFFSIWDYGKMQP